MFAYCGNNPVNNIDPSGTCYYNASGQWCHDHWEYIGGYPRKPDPGYYQGTTPTGLDVYVATDDNYATPPNAVKVVDKRDTNTQNGLPNPDMQIIDSYKYTNRADQVGIFTLIYKYIALNPSVNAWKRSESGLYIEWDLHNLLYSWIKIENFKHADFDNNDEHMLINSFKRIFQR